MVRFGDFVELDVIERGVETYHFHTGATYQVFAVFEDDGMITIINDEMEFMTLNDSQYTIVNEKPLEPVEGSEQVIDTFMDVTEDEGEVFNGVDQNFDRVVHDYHHKNQEPEDMVNHPKHYNSGGMETIDKMEFYFGTKAMKIYCTVNAYKYDSRAGLKGDGVEDNEKATWYIKKAQELQEKMDRGDSVLGSMDYLLD